MTRLLARLADLAYRRRGRMVLAWIVAAVVIIGVGSVARRRVQRRLQHARLGVEGGQRPHRAALRRLLRPGDLRRLEGPGRRRAARPPEQRIDAFFAEAEKVDHIAAHTPIRVSRDGKIGVDHAAADGPRLGRPEGGRREADRRRRGEQRRRARRSSSAATRSTPRRTQTSPEGLGFLGAAIVLLIAFGSVVAAGLPLVIALVGLGISSGGLIVLLANVVDVPDWTTAVSGLIGIGVGIDYSLLVLTRFRSALHDGKDRHDAVVEAVTTAGRSVIIAGSTVVIAVLGLCLTGLPYMYGVAISASLAVLVVMLAAVTLLPALLSYLGPKVDRLRIPFLGRAARRPRATASRPPRAGATPSSGGRGPPRSPRPRSCSRWRRPRSACASASPTPATTRRDTMTRQAYDLNTEGFGPGTNGPLVIAAELPDAGRQGRRSTRSRERLRSEPGVAFVAPPRDQRGGRRRADHRDPDGLAAGQGDRGPGQPAARRRRARRARRLRHHRRDRRRDRGARGPERVHEGPHAAVHRRRRRPLVPAAAGRLPLAADLAEGGDHEPALGRAPPTA